MRKISSIEETLAYQNQEIVRRFALDQEMNLEDAGEIFLEIKRWLWLSAKLQLDIERGQTKVRSLPMPKEAMVLDQMWHTFILYTRDYTDFCHRYFGSYVHHYPIPIQTKADWDERVKSNRALAWQELQTSLRQTYSYISDQLGTETLRKWCVEFPERYPQTAAHIQTSQSKPPRSHSGSPSPQTAG